MSAQSQQTPRAVDTQSPRRRVNPVPYEGDNGVYTQTWFPICLGSDVPVGKIIGRDFLAGRVVVYRDRDGTAHVVSAYCPHLGADLAVGEVVGNNIRCAFHHWEYDCGGHCVKTAVGDPAPAAARLFKFPTVERFGMIFAFNGERPLFEFPDLFPYREDELEIRTWRAGIINCDGWVFSCNTPDMQHLKAVHGVTFLHGDPHKEVEWNEWGFAYNFEGVTNEGKGQARLSWRLGIAGSNLFFQMGTHMDRWYGVLVPFSCPRPNKSEVFASIFTRKANGDPEDARRVDKFLEEMCAFEYTILTEDLPILNTIRYQPGTLTKSDTTLARFLEYLRKYPRAHPSADFIS